MMTIVDRSKEIIQTKLGEAAAWIKDDKGIFFSFDRVAHMDDGGVSLDQMRPDECLLAPGHIYRFDKGLNQ
ncbi:hypothetical protein [Vibrio parahaemolyticus]|uniref:hypothetical protein n=1 Tax=Vibrio parahaemolyticus TaxID=670 RepID=UPI000C86DE87|nr:hypothetical protein [Vibrio parahaemolyticus]PMS49939.1 hypothetical protein C1S89_09080 [Vibrio parahaemolyticus]PMS55010.1 hypothetical protein C1T11_00255 [Vibrio parahaemolyticus]PMS60339.1 hypothetical protein C1T09_00305 [Vibrio parahaemolyticus]PMS90427.1 hypothetical protein C1S90_00305 [Vibrio parahaemolyticus]PMS94183.1 hypothetical protein C1T06_10485 [Vibrio parahaemolyticus]